MRGAKHKKELFDMRTRADGVLFMRDIHAGILKHIFRLCIRGGGGFFYFHQQPPPSVALHYNNNNAARRRACIVS